jgi:hypothetical protein
MSKEEADSPPPSGSGSDSDDDAPEDDFPSPPMSPNQQPVAAGSARAESQAAQRRQDSGFGPEVQSGTFGSPKLSSNVSQPQAATAAAAASRTASRRNRNSVIWNPPPGSSSGVVKKVHRERLLHLLEQSLRYRMIMKPKSIPPSRSEIAHVTSLLYSFLQANSCGRTAALMRDSLAAGGGPNGREGSLLLDEISIGERLDFTHLIQDACRRTCLLFDDDSLYRTDNLLAKDVELQVLDPSSQAVGGSLDLLLEKLILIEGDTPVLEGKPSLNFTTVFMLTNSLFVCPEALFSRLAKLFKTIKSQQLILGDARTLVLQKRVVAVLSSYVSFSSVDICRLLMERITTFCVSIVQAQSSHAEVIKLATHLHGKIQELAGSTACPAPLGTLAPDVAAALLEIPPSNMAPEKPVSTILDVEDQELCRQLCLLSFELARRIHPRELLHAAWTDPALKVLSSNLLEYINYRQLLTRWIATLILSPLDPQSRATILRKVIRLGRALYNCQNFDMCAVVLEGIRHQAVTRLTLTFEGLTASEREELEGLNKVMDPFNTALRDAPYQISSPTLPLLPPFISVFFRSEECGKTCVTQSDGSQLVNWTKMLAIAKPLVRWVSFQATPYRYRLLPHVQRLLWQCSGVRSEDALAALSRGREMPPAVK